MYLQVLVDVWLAGFIMILWQRIISTTKFGKLNWPFFKIEKIIGKNYNSNARFASGVFLWFFISFVLAFAYWLCVGLGWLTYYDFGSAFLYAFILWALTVIIIFPKIGYGLAGLKLGQLVWLESLVSWLIFGIIFGLLIS